MAGLRKLVKLIKDHLFSSIICHFSEKKIFNSENYKAIWWNLKSFEPIIVLIPSFTEIRNPDFLVYCNLSGVECQTHDSFTHK